MSLYELPKFKLSDYCSWLKPKSGKKSFVFESAKNWIFWIVILAIFFSSIFGFLAGAIAGSYFYLEVRDYLNKFHIELPSEKIFERETIVEKEYVPQTTQEEKVIKAVSQASPSVVSIIVTKDLPIVEEYFYDPFGFPIPQYREQEVEKREIGGGTGFVVSEDGLILTNKHVALDQEADYTVLTNDGRKLPAKVLARDPIQDLAVLKIEENNGLKSVKLGDSDQLSTGQTVITIGNALGEFQNTVSVGVISGLGRTITASGGGFYEVLEDIIQTDAAINRGNSGGPLLNLKGEVIGINTAMSVEGENIGFAIPVNKAKKDIADVKKFGRIVTPYLGVYYCLVDAQAKETYNLSVDYGAWIGRNRFCGEYEAGIVEGSAAAKAGLKKGDIILEFNGERVTAENTLAKIIMKYSPGDEITLKVLSGGKERTVKVVLTEKKD